jgi:hypothetical protein
MFSPTVEKPVPPSTACRSWWVSDWFCAIQLAHRCAYAASPPLLQSGGRPAAVRSAFMASITLFPLLLHWGAGAGGGGTTAIGVGAGVGSGGGASVVGGGGVVVGGDAVVVVVVVDVDVVEVVVDVEVDDEVDDEVVASRRTAASEPDESRPSKTTAEADARTTTPTNSAPINSLRVPLRPIGSGSASEPPRLSARTAL